MAFSYFYNVINQARQNSAAEETIYNKEVTKRLKMDDFDSIFDLDKYLGYKCFDDPSEVEIELIRREVHCAWTFNYWHWAWFIRFKNGPRYKYAVVEFLETGIRVLLFAWGQDISEIDARFSVVGDENTLSWDKQFKTKLKWGQIIEKIYWLSSVPVSYKSNNFSRLFHNCQSFAVAFGTKVSDNFDESKVNFEKNSCSIYLPTE